MNIDFQFHEFKPTKLISAETKESWLCKHVKWIKADRQGISKLGINALIALEEILLTISLIGLIPLYLGIRESQGQEKQKKYFLKAEHAQRPSDDPIELKSKTRTFNHVNDFAIQDGIIWTRKRNEESEWKPIYFDGFSKGHTPKALNADGSNLVVLDEENGVHYKKVLKEFRSSEIKQNWRYRHIKDEVNLKNDAYIAFDKSDRNNWKDRWFSLPYIQAIVNLLSGKTLKIPSDAKAWAISHRGRYNHYLEDQAHQHHPVSTGVTTLYVLDANGKDLYKYDPWSPKHVKISIPMPETSHTSFEAENMSVSASTIMAIGYETEKNEPGKSTLKIYTRLSDIDSEGWNPGLKYDYFVHPDNSSVRVVPLPSWESHPLTLNDGDFITKNITILQTGEGNDARELRVEGFKNGEKGFYFKNIKEQDWQFETSIPQLSQEKDKEKAMPMEKSSKPFQSSVYDFKSQQVKFKDFQTDNLTARLLNFGQRSFHSKIVLSLDGQEIECDLYKKKTFKNFMGFEGDSYELVLASLHQNEKLMKALKGHKVIPVTVKQNQTNLVIKSKPSSLFQFSFAQEKS